VRPYLENTHHKKRARGVAQGEGPKFKSKTGKKKFGNQNKHGLVLNWSSVGMLDLAYRAGCFFHTTVISVLTLHNRQ
jgi:hypothetical protein